MELDKRIIEGKRPLTCLDIEQAKEFVGKLCLFSSSFANYKNIREYAKHQQYTGTLSVRDKDKFKFIASEESPYRNGNDGYFYELVLPLEWVEEEEPKKTYRPYSLEEFTENHFYADSIIFRRQDSENNTEEHSMYLGYETAPDLITDAPGNGTVLIGNRRYRLQDLYDYYEIFEDGKWQPFGVIDEEGVGE